MTKKIRSSKGATLIFALVGLLLATMVSAVIIYAAENNARRVRSDQASEQARLAIDSAAELLTDEITGGKYEGQDEYVVKKTFHNTTEVGSTESENYVGSFSKGPDKLIDSETPIGGTVPTIAETIYEWCKSIQHKDAIASITSLDCSGSFIITAPNMEEVCVEISMQPGALLGRTEEENQLADAEKFYITAKLYLADLSSATKAETVVMTFMASADDSLEKSSITESESRNEEEGYVEAVVKETNKVTTTVYWYPTNVIVNLSNNI